MPNCKVCGAPCAANEKYCPFCGSELPQNKVVDNLPDNDNNLNNLNDLGNFENKDNNSGYAFNLFASQNWKNEWRKEDIRKGIILTDTTKLSEPKFFLDYLARYIDFKKRSGIYYYLLDLKDEVVLNTHSNNLENNIKLLRTIYDICVPEFLMIVGDHSVIPPAIWENEAGDDDEVVPSDFAYISLSCDSPWNGKEYDLDSVTRVGRIPASFMTNFNEAIKYFNNVMNFKTVSHLNGFAYSAYQWLETSKIVFGELAGTLHLSPQYLCRPRPDYPDGLILPRLDGYNLLGINLHGSDRSHYWYGQYDDFYPEAFMASLLPDEKCGGYVVCVEACYGARPKVDEKNADSIVVNALQHNCMAFVGSTMIAYGQVNGGMSCADIIAYTFLYAIKEGFDSGTAFIASLVNLLENGDDETTIKTLAEFGLYGDPSVVFYSDSIKKVAFNRVKVKSANINNTGVVTKLIPFNEKVGYYGKKGQSYVTVSFDEKSNHEIKQVAYMVNKSSNDYVTVNYTKFKDTEPVMYKVFGTDEYRSVYTKDIDGVKEIVKLHLDKDGNVTKTYISK